ncbi:uncharacterized protein LOC110814192 [Carica papaya]|uniref:uncharacterized protein LOC110814192 n=1 Tax=Carica papaya TaxID=3649 RepID=UPI000B8C9A34|nr:uncharacterized protein LOC110814192 [Carica papaya]
MNVNGFQSSRKKQSNASKSVSLPEEQDCFGGERLARLLELIRRGIESGRHLDVNSLPEKMWLKQQFAIGVNDVTRVLERMGPCVGMGRSSPQNSFRSSRKAPPVQLQVILVAADCNPQWLTKHLPTLASSRKVPVIFLRDNKEGSLRLGELVKLKTAIVIGVKARGNAINQLLEDILHGNEAGVVKDNVKI